MMPIKKTIKLVKNKDTTLRFKLQAGKLKGKEWCFNVLRDGEAGVYELLKDKISLDEMSKLIYLFFEEMRETILDEKLGIELPLGIGYIQISGLTQTAYKLGGSSKKLQRGIINPNYHTDGNIFKCWYRFTNTDNILKRKVGMFENANLYRLNTAKPFKEQMAKRIKEGKWKHYTIAGNNIEFFPKTKM